MMLMKMSVAMTVTECLLLAADLSGASQSRVFRSSKYPPAMSRHTPSSCALVIRSPRNPTAIMKRNSGLRFMSGLTVLMGRCR